MSLLKWFNNKQEAKKVSNNYPGYKKIGSSVASLGGFFNNLYSFFTDTGKSFSAEETLRQARNYSVSDPVIASLLRTMRNNVIGPTGFTFQSKVSGLSEEKNSEINTKIEYAWYDFTQVQNVDISARFNLTDMLHKALDKYLIDGEIAIRIYYTGKYGIQLQLLDFEAIDYKYNAGNVFNGVEIDGYTKPIAYHILDANGDRYRIPAEQIIHVCNYYDVAKYRGMSFLTPALETLRDINTYNKAEITAAINEATRVLTYESSESYGTAYEGASDLTSFNPNAQPEPQDTISPTLEALASSSIRVGSTSIEALPNGVKLNQLSSNHPSSASPEFQKTFYKRLAAGLGISYLTLMLDLDDSTYSGSRATALLERPTYKRFRTILIEKILNRVYKLWLTEYLSKNKATMPKIDGKYDAYFEFEFMGLGFDYINPKDEADAQVVALNSGLITLTEILAERGKDLEDHLKTLVAEKEKLSQYGINFGAAYASNKPVETPAQTQAAEKPAKKQSKKTTKVTEDDEVTILNGD